MGVRGRLSLQKRSQKEFNRETIEKPGYFASFKPCQLPWWKPTERLHLWGAWLRSSAHRTSQSSATMLRWSCWSTECCIKQLHGVDGAGWEDGSHILWERLGADGRHNLLFLNLPAASSLGTTPKSSSMRLVLAFNFCRPAETKPTVEKLTSMLCRELPIADALKFLFDFSSAHAWNGHVSRDLGGKWKSPIGCVMLRGSVWTWAQARILP